MSEDNLKTLRRTVDALNRGAWEEARLDFDTAGRWPPSEPGSEGSSYLGYEGIRNYLQSWVDNFHDFGLEIVELVDAGDRTFVVVQVSGRGKQSGEETRSPMHALVAQFDGGKILGLTMFMSRDAALQAAGLPETGA
jgi:ketosteroid isomerase-like protein